MSVCDSLAAPIGACGSPLPILIAIILAAIAIRISLFQFPSYGFKEALKEEASEE